jgi:hypothetical protein
MGSIKVNAAEWNSLASNEQETIFNILKSNGLLKGESSIVPDLAVPPSEITAEGWLPTGVCRGLCDVAAAAAVAACTAGTSGLGLAVCLAAAEAARNACRDAC